MTFNCYGEKSEIQSVMTVRIYQKNSKKYEKIMKKEKSSILITYLILLITTAIVDKTKGIPQDQSDEKNPFDFEIPSAPSLIQHLSEEINDEQEPKIESNEIRDESETDIELALENSLEYIKDELQQNALYTAFTEIAKDRSSLCYKELQQIRSEYKARKPWAMKVLDATGLRPPGFLLGNNQWLGSRATCNAAQYTTSLLMSDNFKRNMKYGILNETAPFDVGFKVVYLDFKTPWQVDWKFLPPEKTIAWGICLPVSCSNMEIAKLMELYINTDKFMEREILNITATISDVKDLGLTIDFFVLTSVKILFGILGFTFVMIIAAMCLRLRSTIPEQQETDSMKSNKKPEEHPLIAFVKCYDVKHNLTKIFHINESNNGEINEICAIRSINANFIVILHVLFFGLCACVNRTTLFGEMKRSVVGVVFVVVEAFFILSGFLQTYNFLRNQQQRQLIKDTSFSENAELFIKKLFHRWLRLAPPLYFIVCLNSVLHALVYRISVYQLPYRDDLLIVDSWWRYLFFLQNTLPVEKTPVNWTWSMACEMQFFIIGTILLFIYAKYPVVGKVLFLTVVIGSILTYFKNGIETNFTWHYDVAFTSLSEMYANTFVRIISYLMGMLAAWYVVEKPCFVYSIIESAIGNLSLIAFGIIISPLCDGTMTTPVMSTLALLLIRLTISFWICWLVIAAATKRRTWLSPILELKFFQPSARLSYVIYLLNPIVVVTMASLTNMGILFDYTTTIIWAAGTMFLTKWIAVIICVAFEMPYCNLSSLLLKSEMVKKL